MDFTTKTDILVFFANAIDTVGEDGSQIKGCSIHYVFMNTLSSRAVVDDVRKPVGMQRGKSWMDYGMRSKVRIAPAIYEGTFEMAVGSDGKPSLKLVDIGYKSNVEFVPYLVPAVEHPGMIHCDAPSSSELQAVLEQLSHSAEADPKSGKKPA